MVIISEGTPEFWAQKLREHCNDGRIDFDEMSLEQDMMVGGSFD